MTALPDYLEPLGDGIYAIDTGFQRPRFDAAYLMIEAGRACFIDTGTNHAVPRLLGALQALGLGPEAVDHVIATHVHLDHAGGVGLLMKSLPQAQVLVHPRGARHLIDPRVLYAGALAVYGQEEMDRSYGRVIGVDAERVSTSEDGMVLHLAGRPLRLIDTPGHARHHHCIWDERSRGWFTGDTFGISFREFDRPGRTAFIFPTATPVQFEPGPLRESVQRLLQSQPQCMYLTHYGRVTEVPALADEFLLQLQQMEAMGAELRHAPDRHEALKAALRRMYAERLRATGRQGNDAELDLLKLDVELNAQGMAVWLDRSKEGA